MKPSTQKLTRYFRLPFVGTLFAAALCLPYSAVRAQAQIPILLNYQGRVAVDSVNFEGAGTFKFALVNEAGDTTYWSNDGTSTTGNEPASGVQLTVTKGLYSILLGDTNVPGTLSIDPTIFSNPDVRLRVWFDDGVNGVQLLEPDQRLAPTVYLADGAVTSAALADGSVLGTKIAPATIVGTNVAPGSLDFSHFYVPAAPAAGQVLSFDGGSLNWITAGASDGIWALNGTNAFYNAGMIGIGTNAPAHTLSIGGAQPAWTSNIWAGAVGLTNPSAIGWKPNSAGFAAGIGHTNGGLAFFRTTSELGTTDSPALYDLFINDAGCVCVGTLSPNPSYLLAVNGAVQFTPGGTGGTMQFGTPNFESGMTWANANTRADLRFDGTAVKLLAGAAGGPPGNASGVAVRTNGNVGIGTDNPVSKLEIVSQDALSITGYQPFLTLRDSNTGNSRGRIQSTGGNLIFATESYLSGSNINNFAQLNANGNFSVKSLTIRGGADLAEPFAVMGKALELGSVVVIDEENPGHLKRSAAAYDKRVAGIISGANGINPGISLHQEGLVEGGQNVALSGRVYVQADASGAAIMPGDMLTTSETPGHAMKAQDSSRAQGAVIGKAMSALPEGCGFVLVLVTLQ